MSVFITCVRMLGGSIRAGPKPHSVHINALETSNPRFRLSLCA